jgi:hypothetical protein
VNAKGQKTGGELNGAAYTDQVVSGPMKDFMESLRAQRDQEILVMEDGAPAHHRKVVEQACAAAGIQC